MSGIISQDITQRLDLPYNRNGLSQRDQMILKAYENQPWRDDTTTTTTTNKLGIITDRDLLFQILMIENISRSKQTQLDEINSKLDPKNQRVDRLNASKINLRGNQNHEMISQIDLDDNSNTTNNNNNTNKPADRSKDVYKLTIQGKNGVIFFAVNTSPINWSNCALGTKLIIKKGTFYDKKIFILNESNMTFLGGINRIWNENRNLKVQDYLNIKLNRDKPEKKTSTTTRKRKSSALS